MEQKNPAIDLSRIPPALLLVVLLVGCLLLYAVCSGDYFLYDSQVAISENGAIAIDGTQLDQWRLAALSSDSGPLGRPLSMLSFALNHVIAPDSLAYSVRIGNALLHVLIGLLMYLACVRVLRDTPVMGWEHDRARRVALLAAALWLLHPLHVSTVLYGVQRMAQLPALFVLLGVLFYLRERCRWLDDPPAATDWSRALLGVTSLTLLAGFSKENGLLLPWLLALIEALFFRYRIAGRDSSLLKWAVILGFSLPFALLAARFAVQPDWLTQWFAHRDFTAGERLLSQARILWFYIGQLLLPDIRGMGLHHDDIPVSVSLLQPTTTLIAVAAWIALLAGAWQVRRRFPLFTFAVFWYLVAHVVESSLVPLLMAFEHRNYLPSLGLFLWLSSVLASPHPGWKPYRAGISCLVVLALAALLLMRALPWRDAVSLAERQYQRKPDSVASIFSLATTYYNHANALGADPQAQQFYAASDTLHQRALEFQPDFVPSLVALVYIRSHSSNPEAVAGLFGQLREALASPNLAPGSLRYLPVLTDCISVGECHVPVERFRTMLEELSAANPQQWLLQDMRIRLCALAEDWACAEEAIAQVLAQRPDSSAALRALLTQHARRGDVREALEVLRQMMREDPQRRNLRAVSGFIGVGR